MKRLFVLMIITVLLLVGCNSSQDNSQERYDEVIYTSASNRYARAFDDLVNRSNNIVRGRIADDSKIVFQTHIGHNLVSLEILEVIKGDLKVGDTINILEPYFIRDRVLRTWADYMPSIPNQEYIFSLTDPTDDMPEGYEGAYFVSHGERGRYLVLSNARASIQEFSREDLSLGENANIDLYMSLYQDVINAYMR